MSRNSDVVICLSCPDTENDDMSGASPQSIWHMAQVDLCETNTKLLAILRDRNWSMQHHVHNDCCVVCVLATLLACM